MSEEQNGDFLSKIKGRIGSITAVIVGLVVLLTAVENLFNVSSKLIGTVQEEQPAAPPSALEDCFKAEMRHPDKVTISQWPKMPLSLTGQNDCQGKLIVHIAYKAKQLDEVRIESPFANCLDPVNPDCWEVISLDAGELDEKFTPPNLKLLKIPLGDPISININWVIYNQTLQLLDAGRAQIELLDDPQ